MAYILASLKAFLNTCSTPILVFGTILLPSPCVLIGFSPKANFMVLGAPCILKLSGFISPNLCFIVSHCPPMALAEPCIACDIVTPPARARYIETSRGFNASPTLTSAVTGLVASFTTSRAICECASIIPGIT